MIAVLPFILPSSVKVKISIDSVHNIIYDHMGKIKVSARWVPSILKKQNFITTYMDETWLHHEDPETKHQSMSCAGKLVGYGIP